MRQPAETRGKPTVRLPLKAQEVNGVRATRAATYIRSFIGRVTGGKEHVMYRRLCQAAGLLLLPAAAAVAVGKPYLIFTSLLAKVHHCFLRGLLFTSRGGFVLFLL